MGSLEIIDPPSAPRGVKQQSPSCSKSQTGNNTELGYNITSGAADMAGELFEIKMLALIFLRLVGAGVEFSIASNMKEAGLFDDIVVRSRTSPQDVWKTSLLQLKHMKSSKTLSRSMLLRAQEKFSLVKYCNSYSKIKAGKSDALKPFGSFDDYRFIIFTNTALGDDVGRECVAEQLFNTGGKSCVLDEDVDILGKLHELADFKTALLELGKLLPDMMEQDAASVIGEKMTNLGKLNESVKFQKKSLLDSPSLQKIVDLLKELEAVRERETYTEFLGKLQFYTEQASHTELDPLIKEELGNVWNINSAEPDSMLYNVLIESITSWWQKPTYFLTPTSQFWSDLITMKIDKLSRISVLKEFGIDFLDEHLQSLYFSIPRSGVMIVSVDSLTTATAIKVMRAFARLGSGENVLHVDLATLLEKEDEVLAVWSNRWCDRLVIEYSSDLDNDQVSRLTEKIKKVVYNGKGKLVILVANMIHTLCTNLSGAKCLYSRVEDKSDWNDLTEQSQDKILATSIDVQGVQIVLSDLVDERFLSYVDLEIISQLLQKDPHCGKSLDEAGKFFVARRLERSGEEININSVGDVTDKVVIVGAEPGMGKSTIMQQLARSAKQVDPCCWSLQIRLCDCTKILQSVSSDVLTPVQAREFLGRFALDSGHGLEETLFECWKHSICVFIDGVDEVCPLYERQVMSLLKSFTKLEMKQIWVASRPICIAKLELELGVISYELVHFTNEDQAICIASVWKMNSPETSSASLKKNTQELLNLLRQVLGEGNPILGVPLMTILIAETFQNRVIKISKSATSESIKKIDVLFLFKSFVRKKFDIYYDEKKQTKNRDIPANYDDEEKKWQSFLTNHQFAALSVIFGQSEIEVLKFDGKDKFSDELAAFCKEIAEGRERTGIIDNISADGVPHFVHRTFAEFFATTWLVENYIANPEFTKRILFNAEFRLMSDMFNSFLASGHPLHSAVANRDRAGVEQLLCDEFLSPKTLASVIDHGGRSCLHLAVFFSVTTRLSEYFDLAEYFMELRVRTDLADRVLGWQPWQYAAHFNAWPLVRLILVHTREEEVALMQAVNEPNFNIFFAYLAQKSESSPDASLMLSVAKDAVVSVVRYLVEERGGNVFCRGPLGVSMMHRAAEGGNIEVISYLQSLGVDPDTKNDENATPIHYAALYGSYHQAVKAVEFIGKLISSREDQEIATAIDLSSKTDSDTAGCNLCIVNGLFSNAVCEGDTPLHVASRRGITEVVSFLLARGADIEGAHSKIINSNVKKRTQRGV